MTKCEVLVCRALRDSRKKSEHVLKYTAAYSAETGADWADAMFQPLMERVRQLLPTT